MNDLGKTLFTTISGIFGGLFKAFSGIPLTINFPKTIEVFFFACISATAGYLVKCLLDQGVKKYRRRKRQNNRKS